MSQSLPVAKATAAAAASAKPGQGAPLLAAWLLVRKRSYLISLSQRRYVTVSPDLLLTVDSKLSLNLIGTRITSNRSVRSIDLSPRNGGPLRLFADSQTQFDKWKDLLKAYASASVQNSYRLAAAADSMQVQYRKAFPLSTTDSNAHHSMSDYSSAYSLPPPPRCDTPDDFNYAATVLPARHGPLTRTSEDVSHRSHHFHHHHQHQHQHQHHHPYDVNAPPYHATGVGARAASLSPIGFSSSGGVRAASLSPSGFSMAGGVRAAPISSMSPTAYSTTCGASPHCPPLHHPLPHAQHQHPLPPSSSVSSSTSTTPSSTTTLPVEPRHSLALPPHPLRKRERLSPDQTSSMRRPRKPSRRTATDIPFSKIGTAPATAARTSIDLDPDASAGISHVQYNHHNLIPSRDSAYLSVSPYHASQFKQIPVPAVQPSTVMVKTLRRPSSPIALSRVNASIAGELLFGLSGVRHFALLHVLDVFQEVGEVHIVSEYCIGGSLLQYVDRNGPLPEHVARALFKPLVRAVGHLHSKGLVHWGVHPSSVQLDTRVGMQPKLGNFSSVRPIDLASGRVLEQHEVFARATDHADDRYLSLELLNGTSNQYATAVDMWQLGCLLHFLLFASHPFDGRRDKANAQLRHYCERRGEERRAWIMENIHPQFVSAVSEEGKVLVDNLLCPNPRMRPSALQCLKHSAFLS